MIRDHVLHTKSNMTIQATLSLVYGKDAVCQGAVDMLAARFRSGRTSIEDDERPGRPSSDRLSDIVSGYLNGNPDPFCREIAKDLFIPKTTVLHILDEMGLGFFVARWMPSKLSPDLKTKRIDICQEMLELLEQPDS
jgi:hypothetical protein